MRIVPLIAILTISLGCAARDSTPNAEGPRGVFRSAGLHEVSDREYRVDPPDELIIRSPEIKELDNQRVIVRPDGKVSLDLVGDLPVSGKTAKEIADDLKKETAKYYVKPEIRLDVVANSKFYYVLGFGVGAGQGKLPYTGRVTVLNALASAGFTVDAWPEQVRISRPGRFGAPDATAIIDFSKMMQYGDLSQNYLVEEGDIVYVPYNPLSAWNFTVQRLLGPLTGTASLVATPVGVIGSTKGGL